MIMGRWESSAFLWYIHIQVRNIIKGISNHMTNNHAFYTWLFVMRVLMPFPMSLTWMQIYRRKALLAQRPMIIIVSGYTLAR